MRQDGGAKPVSAEVFAAFRGMSDFLESQHSLAGVALQCSPVSLLLHTMTFTTCFLTTAVLSAFDNFLLTAARSSYIPPSTTHVYRSPCCRAFSRSHWHHTCCWHRHCNHGISVPRTNLRTSIQTPHIDQAMIGMKFYDMGTSHCSPSCTGFNEPGPEPLVEKSGHI